MTVEYKGVELEVEYDYQPEEAEERFYPGCSEQITITDIKIGDVSVWELLEDDVDSIEELMYDIRNENNY